MTSFASTEAREAVQFKEYFVVRRGSEWWIVDDAVSAGPHLLREAAVEAAMNMALKDVGNQITTKVFVEEKLMGDLSLVYDSAVDSRGWGSHTNA
jgi:hypothetical protein